MIYAVSFRIASEIARFDVAPPAAPANIEEVVARRAEDIAECYKIPVTQAVACLDRLVDTLAPDLRQRPETAAGALERFPLTLFSDALSSMPAEQAVTMILTRDLVDLVRRVLQTEYLLDEGTPLLLLAELSAQIQDIREFHAAHRKFLIKTGMPPRSFPYLWLYRKLGWLYPTRWTASPYPRKVTSSPQKRQTKPYQWLQTPGHCCMGAHIRPCEYHSADFLWGLKAQSALRLEEDRASLFALRATLLDRVQVALASRSTTGLLDDCLRHLASALSTEDIDFLLKIDRVFLGRDVTSAAEVPDERRPGGLTDWLELVGHVECELAVGSLAGARKSLTGPVRAKILGILPAVEVAPAYLHLFGMSEHSELDAALDHLLAQEEAENAHWAEFRQRVKSHLATTFRATVEIPVSRQNRPVLEPVLKRYAEQTDDRLNRGEWIDRPPAGASIFRCDGDSWTIYFEGKLIGKPDSVGLFYIRELLANPNKTIGATILRARYNLWVGEACSNPADGQPIGEVPQDQETDLGEAYDAPAAQDYAAAISRLQEEIDAAEQAENRRKADAIREELAVLKQHMKEGHGPQGRRRQSRPHKKDRDQVCNAINSALKSLRESHPTLHQHLERALELGVICAYRPPSLPPWQL